MLTLKYTEVLLYKQRLEFPVEGSFLLNEVSFWTDLNRKMTISVDQWAKAIATTRNVNDSWGWKHYIVNFISFSWFSLRQKLWTNSTKAWPIAIYVIPSIGSQTVTNTTCPFVLNRYVYWNYRTILADSENQTKMKNLNFRMSLVSALKSKRKKVSCISYDKTILYRISYYRIYILYLFHTILYRISYDKTICSLLL